MERSSKKRIQLWKKAIVHFILCFVMGFFTGFAPSSKSSTSITHDHDHHHRTVVFNESEASSQSMKLRSNLLTDTKKPEWRKVSEVESGSSLNTEKKLNPKTLLIIITPISTKHRSKLVFLRRLSDTLRLVDQPLLWIVIEEQTDSSEVSELLRKTGIMYRHLVFDEKFDDPNVEMDHQRNIALNHIEHHRLSGIVHFAGLSNVYDLDFFHEIRSIEVFGTWPMALLSANRKRVIIEGPICDSSQVIGWHLRKKKNESGDSVTSPFHISSFAFNSSILWDPERWGRPSSTQDNSQNSMKFVKQMVLEDDTKLEGIPPEDCSKIMVWHLHFQATNINHLLVASSDINSR